MMDVNKSRFANRKTISLSNKELIDAVLADRKAVLNSGGYQIDEILMGNAPPLFSGKNKELEIIVKEHYCDEDAVTVMLRRILHSLEGMYSGKEYIDSIIGKIAQIVQKHIPADQTPTFDIAPALVVQSTKNHLLMHLGRYLDAITLNPYISETVRANLQATWTGHVYLFSGTLSPAVMGYMIGTLLDDMSYPGMVERQLYFLSAMIDCLVFPNTPESRLGIITAIQDNICSETM